jgi:hypothetical protein
MESSIVTIDFGSSVTAVNPIMLHSPGVASYIWQFLLEGEGARVRAETIAATRDSNMSEVLMDTAA